jgi:hypothetical protein
MRTLGKIAATVGVVGAIAVGSVAPAAAWYGYNPYLEVGAPPPTYSHLTRCYPE